MLKPTDQQVSALYNAKLLSVDTEGKDPDLVKKGPSTQRGGGFTVGASFAMREPGKVMAFYLPVKHPDTTVEDSERNAAIIAHLVSSPNEKIGANLLYDIEWLEHQGYKFHKKGLHDIQYAEPLLDEYRRSYSLDSLAEKYLKVHKQTSVIAEYATMMGWKGKPVTHIWRMPERVAEEYALADATYPLKIHEFQKAELERQNLWDLYRMECALMPLLWKMRRNGVRLDVPKLKKTSMALAEKRFALMNELEDWAGKEVNPNSPAQLAKLFDARGIPYPRNLPTEKMAAAGKPGSPNIDKNTLNKLVDRFPICQKILDFRHYNTLLNMFMQPYGEALVDDRLFGQFHPLKSDDYGTVAGRFSATKPNLQQVSAAKEDDEEDVHSALEGQIVRQLFIPEEGMRWAKLDYSQVEYRVMAHYAMGRGAEELRRMYNSDASTDFHQVVMDQTGQDRRTAKRLNFGGMYGMGVATTAANNGWTMEQAAMFMDQYHSKAPFIKATRKAVTSACARRGYIFTLKGRKARTHRSRKLHSMFNRLIQGSAADVMKEGMVAADDAGLFEELVPHITVHDELDVSYRDTPAGNEALQELKRLMETTTKLSVPLLVDCHTGANWAEAD